MFDGDLDPADNLGCDGRDEGGLVFGALREGFDPAGDFVEWTLISELFNQHAGRGCILWLDCADQEWGG